MKIASLGFLTNMIFTRFSGLIEDRGFYTLVKTPNNPGYFWGNYLVFDKPPQTGDLENWKEIFQREFGPIEGPQHYLFAWEDSPKGIGDIQTFLDAGFVLDPAVVLTANTLTPPPFLNESVQIKKVSTDLEWSEVVELQIICADKKFVDRNYREFKQRQFENYRKMSEARRGNWFGAYLDGRLVGDLGVFFEGDLGRYQNVETHPDQRGRGICGTLVYLAGLKALEDYGISLLVMEADPAYHAARIYESVGFRKHETNHALMWWTGEHA